MPDCRLTPWHLTPEARVFAEMVADSSIGVTRRRYRDDCRSIAWLTLLECGVKYRGPESGFKGYLTVAIRRRIWRYLARERRYIDDCQAHLDSLTVRPESELPDLNLQALPEDDRALLEAIRDGVGIPELASRYTVDRRTVCRHIQRAVAHAREILGGG